MAKKAPTKRATKGKSIAPLQSQNIDTDAGLTASNNPESSEAAGTNPGREQSTPPETEKREGEMLGGDSNSSAGSISDSASGGIEAELSSRVSRLPGEGRSGCHERLRRLARAAGLPRGQGPGTAYNWALEQVDRLFAELNAPEPEPETATQPEPDEPEKRATVAHLPENATVAAVAAPPKEDSNGVSGLSSLPTDWPELPANAQLQVEIAWVSANRLRVRDGTGVNLAKALSPAPSYSALSWLETSILFPAKFADISVKATADNDNEREFIRREKLAIEEIRDILKEMLAPGDV